MEINGKSPVTGMTPRVELTDLNKSKNPAAHKPVAENARSDSDRIELSIQSRSIQNLDEMIRSTPDTRDARIEELRLAIQSGTYNVKAEKIADKILAENMIDETL